MASRANKASKPLMIASTSFVLIYALGVFQSSG